jgi:imidazolonepropionase-like amidohydrolase
MGQIKAGFLADAVLLSADPMDDIRNTRSIEAVIHQGKLLSRAHLDQLVTP